MGVVFMGGCLEKLSPEDKELARKNRAIENFLKNERRGTEDDIKLLLLGTGGSGKSTIAKQMRIIHLTGFSPEEKASFKKVIHNNVLVAITTLIEEAQKREIELQDTSSVEQIQSISPSLSLIKYDNEVAKAVQSLWTEKGIREVFTRSSEFQLDDSASYFLDNCHKFAKKDFIPEECDILRARAKTTGIVEITFVVNKNNYMLVDVGGQRNERKKWMHCFQDVTSVIFCAALNEYDMLLEEDNFTNRMHESLKVFEEVINSPFFVETPIILFLNKLDLFVEKIKRVNLDGCFPQYTGGLNEEKGREYILKKYQSKNNNKARKIF